MRTSPVHLNSLFPDLLITKAEEEICRSEEKSGSLCALLWRILSWCTRKQVTLRAHHISGWLNVIADKLYRLGQSIQTEWSEVFKAICSRWPQPQVDLFATRFNNKLPQFVSPVPDPQAWAVDALSLSWENLDPYAFPPAAILGKVVEKLQDYPCNRIILIAPGWPNMPWFWDLVAMSFSDPTVPAQHTQLSVSAFTRLLLWFLMSFKLALNVFSTGVLPLLFFGETLPSAYQNILLLFYCTKMSSHQASSKPRSSKCRHFCFPFNLHNYCPTCRESGKGDDPCVTNLSACNICDNLTDEQRSKIKNRRRYTQKQRSDANTSKEDLDLLGDDEESFTGTQADLEGAAETLFSSPPRPLQNKIEDRLEKSLGSSLPLWPSG